MKIRKIIYVVVAVLLFSACSKDGENNNSTGDKKWVSFKVALPSGSPGSRSVDGLAAGTEYTGTNDEKKITSVRVVLYANDQVAYAFDLTASADGSAPIAGADVSTASAATATYFVSKGREVLSQSYKMAVFVNPTSAMLSATAETHALTELETAAASISAATFVTANGIMMSNAQGLINVTTADLYADEANAENSPVPVAVDRAVAKVFVNVPAAGITVLNGASGDAVVASSIVWALDITNKKSFYIRKQAPALTANGTISTAAPKAAETIGSSAVLRYSRYAEDPNWIGFAALPAGHATLLNEFNYYDETNATFNGLGWDDADGRYVLENTMNDVDQWEVETTRVLVKMNYVPNGITAATNWLGYKGYIFTTAAFHVSAETAITETFAGNLAEIVGLPAGFKADMATLYTTNSGTLAAVYDPAIFNALMTAAFEMNNLRFYLGGMSYYNVLIRHFDDTQQPMKMQYGRYGVVRNNIYKVELSSVRGPGTPTVVPPDGPDDKDTGYLSAEISVLPWIVRVQSVNL